MGSIPLLFFYGYSMANCANCLLSRKALAGIMLGQDVSELLPGLISSLEDGKPTLH